MVRLQTLDLRIGVRVPASQPILIKSPEGRRPLVRLDQPFGTREKLPGYAHEN
jgi:hypothetical protein